MTGYDLTLRYRFRIDPQGEDPDAVAAEFARQVSAWVGGYLGGPPFAAALVSQSYEATPSTEPDVEAWSCITVSADDVRTFALMDLDSPPPADPTLR